MVPPMSKRNVATVLWFLMGWTLGSMVAVFSGYPSILGLALGLPVAALVHWGIGRLWPEPKRLDGRRVISPDAEIGDPAVPEAYPAPSSPAR